MSNPHQSAESASDTLLARPGAVPGLLHIATQEGAPLDLAPLLRRIALERRMPAAALLQDIGDVLRFARAAGSTQVGKEIQAGCGGLLTV